MVSLSKKSVEDDLLLKFLYAANFDLTKTLKKLKDFLIWRKSTDKLEPNNKIIELLVIFFKKNTFFKKTFLLGKWYNVPIRQRLSISTNNYLLFYETWQNFGIFFIF